MTTIPSFSRLARRSFSLRIGVFLIFVGCGLALGGAEEWKKGERLRRDGIVAEGTVIAKSIDPARRGGNPRTRYLVTVRFTAGETPMERVEEVGVEEWEALVEGGPISVTYLATDPGNAAAAAPVVAWVATVMGGLGLLFGVLGAALLFPALARIRLVRRLHREGEPAQGTVLDVFPTGTVIDRVRQWRLRYEFADPLGRAVRGESDLIRPDEAARWKPGDAGSVRHDRDRPEASIWLLDPELPEPPAPAGSFGRGWLGVLRLIRTAVAALVLVFVAAVIAEVPPAKSLVLLIAEERKSLIAPVVGLLSLGFLLFMGGIISMIQEKGEPLGRAELDDHARSIRFAATPAAWRATRYRFRGKGAGSSADESYTFRELKDAWRRGLVRRDPGWRRRAVTLVGALAMSFGLFSLFVVIGPPWLKVLFIGVMLYVSFKLARGFLRA